MKMILIPPQDRMLSEKQRKDKEQELSLLEKHTQKDREQMRQMESRELEVKMTRMKQYSELQNDPNLTNSEKVALMNGIDKMEKHELEKLDEERKMCQVRLSLYEKLKRDVKNNVPPAKRSHVKYPCALPDDMAS